MKLRLSQFNRYFYLAISLATFAVCSNAQAKSETLIGTALSLDTGALVYTENHTLSNEGGQQVMRTHYLDPERQSLANREVFYDAGRVSSYQLTQSNISYREAVSRTQNTVDFAVDGEQLQRKSATIKGDLDVVIDAGFNELILRHWDALLAGEKLTFSFASTAQLDLVRLQIVHDDNLSSEQVAMFSMTAANVLYRMLMKPIKAGFYRDTKQLAYYRGASNLKDRNGDSFKVEISFANHQLSPKREL